MASKKKNPIEWRLDLIHNSWVEFSTLPDARVLCWLVLPDEVRMVEAFIAVASDERSGTLPDLFVQLGSPFEALHGYGYALCGEFAGIATRLYAGLDDPATPEWAPPQAKPGEDDVSLWLRTNASFHQHYQLHGQFVSVLQPSAISDVAAFQIWLQRFAAAAAPTQRLIVLDHAKSPGLTPLVQAEPIRVVAKPLDLDMAKARLEISENAGGLDTPGGQYRHLFVKLTNALGEAKLPEALSLGTAALAITQAQSWFALAVPIHFALGAALAGHGNPTEANEHYLQAEVAAAEGEKAGDPTCKRLRAQARMARGGLLVSTEQYPAAAQLFTDTVPFATAAEDPRMVLDCYRLASFSYEQNGEYDKAWNSGVEGMRYAKQLDQETRDTSTLPYLGEGMLRLTQRPEYSSSAYTIDREMTVLMGTKDWRPAPPPPQQAAVNPPGAGGAPA